MNRDHLGIPKKQFQPRKEANQAPPYRHYNPDARSMNSKPFIPNPPMKYSEEIPKSQNTNYKRVFSIAALMYPCLNLETVQHILVENNLTLTDRALETLSLASKAADNSSNPYHLNDIEISSYKTTPCTQRDQCTDTYCNSFHSLGEKRRVPVLYSEELCPKYFNCPKGDACEFAHNKIEQAYHPKRISWFYEEAENGKIEEFRLEDLNQKQLERVRVEKLKMKNDVIKDLENRLIEISKIKKRFLCGICRAGHAMAVAKPCGHLYCLECKEEDSCVVCKGPCEFYYIDRN